MRWIAIIFMALLVATVTIAALPNGEAVITSDGGVRLTGGNGAIEADVLANGTARVTFFSIGAGGVVAETWPSHASGNAYFSLRDGLPRPFDLAGSGADSVYVDLIAATEVIVTWR